MRGVGGNHFPHKIKQNQKTMAEHILIVDDEEGIRFSLRGILEDEGYEVTEASSAEEALVIVKNQCPDLVFLDIWLPKMDGLEALQKLKEAHSDLPIIMISGHGTIETAVQALHFGAHDFVEKPLSLEKILVLVRHALEIKGLRKENSMLRQAVSLEGDFEMVANSAIMQKFYSELQQVAPTNAWVLITGENGTGKELTARTLHLNSKLSKAPFVAVNCAAIPEELIESELFGHEKGAFTGADTAKVGKFELANGGTLFLDEIADMSLKTQAKILRILQEQRFERVGGTKTIEVDVRVVAATNKDLVEAIDKGEFRQDLYYRLRVFPLHVPPLRERKEDIPALINNLSKQVERKYSMPVPAFSDAAMQVLTAWSWPGNIRELLHLLERLTILYSGKIVDYHLLPHEMLEDVENIVDFEKISATAFPPLEMAGGQTDGTNKVDFNNFLEFTLQMDYKNAKNAFESFYLQHKLEEAGGNVTKLAELIGLERSNVHRKLRAGKVESDQ